MATYRCASSSFVDVRAMAVSSINTSLTHGDEVIVPNGTSNWGTNSLVLDKAIYLHAASHLGATIITDGLSYLQTPIIVPDSLVDANGPMRIADIVVNGNNVANPRSSSVCAIYGDVGGPYHKLVIENCKFQDMPAASTTIYIKGHYTGVIAGCTFTDCDEIFRQFGNDYMAEFTTFPYNSYAFGSIDNFWFEENIINFTRVGGNIPGWFETGQGGRIGMRFNREDFTNNASTSREWQDSHGFQSWYEGGSKATGTQIVENYGNTVLGSLCDSLLKHRGGWGMFHNNVISGGGNNKINAQQYGPNDPPGGGQGGGCQLIVESFGSTSGDAGGHTFATPLAFSTEINSTYVFNNTLNGSPLNMGVGATSGNTDCSPQVLENPNPAPAKFEGYWNNASIDATHAGVGRGSVPPTMTAPDGSLYYMASNPLPPTVIDAAAIANIQGSTIYRRIGGVWVVYYTPLPFPHPLRTSKQPSFRTVLWTR